MYVVFEKFYQRGEFFNLTCISLVVTGRAHTFSARLIKCTNSLKVWKIEILQHKGALKFELNNYIVVDTRGVK